MNKKQKKLLLLGIIHDKKLVNAVYSMNKKQKKLLLAELKMRVEVLS